MNKTIRIGSRKSGLALAQTELVAEAMKEASEGLAVEVVTKQTEGDRILDKPLVEFGGKGVFVSEFEQALLKGEIDFAVHSAKDLPMDLEDGLAIVGIPKRGDPRDVLVVLKDGPLAEKLLKVKQTGKRSVMTEPQSCKEGYGEKGRAADSGGDDHADPADHADRGAQILVGTSSLRRQLQAGKVTEAVWGASARCESLRGNVQTRLHKLEDGTFDAVILAAVGLLRLGFDLEADERFLFYCLPCEEFIPAGGQGILAVEGREDDPLSALAVRITDEETKLCLRAERRVLRLLDAGCHEPIGVYASIDGDRLTISGICERQAAVATVRLEGDLEEWERLAQTAAGRLAGR